MLELVSEMIWKIKVPEQSSSDKGCVIFNRFDPEPGVAASAHVSPPVIKALISGGSEGAWVQSCPRRVPN